MRKVAIIIVVLAFYTLFILGYTFAHKSEYVRSNIDKLGLKNEAINEGSFELNEFGDPAPPPPGGGP